MGGLAEILRRLLEMPAEKLRRVVERLGEEHPPADTPGSGSEQEGPDCGD